MYGRYYFSSTLSQRFAFTLPIWRWKEFAWADCYTFFCKQNWTQIMFWVTLNVENSAPNWTEIIYWNILNEKSGKPQIMLHFNKIRKLGSSFYQLILIPVVNPEYEIEKPSKWSSDKQNVEKMVSFLLYRCNKLIIWKIITNKTELKRIIKRAWKQKWFLSYMGVLFSWLETNFDNFAKKNCW